MVSSTRTRAIALLSLLLGSAGCFETGTAPEDEQERVLWIDSALVLSKSQWVAAEPAEDGEHIVDLRGVAIVRQDIFNDFEIDLERYEYPHGIELMNQTTGQWETIVDFQGPGPSLIPGLLSTQGYRAVDFVDPETRSVRLRIDPAGWEYGIALRALRLNPEYWGARSVELTDLRRVFSFAFAGDSIFGIQDGVLAEYTVEGRFVREIPSPSGVRPDRVDTGRGFVWMIDGDENLYRVEGGTFEFLFSVRNHSVADVAAIGERLWILGRDGGTRWGIWEIDVEASRSSGEAMLRGDHEVRGEDDVFWDALTSDEEALFLVRYYGLPREVVVLRIIPGEGASTVYSTDLREISKIQKIDNDLWVSHRGPRGVYAGTTLISRFRLP